METVSGPIITTSKNADFEQVVRNYGKILTAFVLRRAPEHDVDDIVQETFVKAYMKIHTLQNSDSLKPWLFAICRHCLSSHLRQKSSDADLHFNSEIWQEMIDSSQENRSVEDIQNTMQLLEYEKRRYLILKYWAGFNYAEIAVLLQTTAKKVKSRMYESRQLLKNLLRDSLLKKHLTSQQSLKEKIMNKLETIKNTAEIFDKLSLASQLKFAEFVRDNKKFDTELLAACAEVGGGAEAVTAYHGKLSIQEFADILQAVDDGTMRRLFTALEKNHIDYANELKTEIALAEVNIMPTESLHLETEKVANSGDTIIIHLTGYLDTYNSLLFENKLRTLITAGYRFLILDCLKFTYISSSGIGALVVLLKDISLQNGTIFLCNLANGIWEVFSLLGFNAFFTKTESINQTLEICRKGQPSPIAGESDEHEIMYLLPKENRGDSRLRISGYNLFRQEAAGSYYDYKQLDGNNWAVIMSEASGTGTNAQLIRSKIAASFHNYFEHADAPYNLPELMYVLNSQVSSLNIKNRFGVVSLLLVNGEEGTCTVCNAGGYSLAVYKQSEQEIEVLPIPIGPVTGTFPNWLVRDRNPYTAVEFHFSRGDELYLFTDGLEESENAVGESFGRERIAELITAEHLVAAKKGTPSPEISRTCVDALASSEKRFRGEGNQQEDIMIVAIAFI